MDILLDRVTSQAMNFAIRSGVTITATYAIRQCGRLLKEAPRSKEREELMQLQLRLESKIRIISPAIDMIDLISARGNTSLESAVSLTKDIRYEIQKLGTRLSNAANEEELLRRKSSRAKSREQTEYELKACISAIKALLFRIEDAVPLISLAITTSGVTLSTKLSGTISPSRLLQASTFLTAADSKFTAEMGTRQQVGPTYTVSLYMLFAGHAGRMVNETGIRGTTWKEVMHKAKVKLVRVPLDRLYDLPGETSNDHDNAANTLRGEVGAAEFAYQLIIIEDLDDDRVHTFEDNEPRPGPFDGVLNAGIRDLVPVHEVSKIFYADTGKILDIGGDSDVNSPVLLLRRDVHAKPPRRMMHRSETEHGDYFDSPAANGTYDADDVQSQLGAQFERESAPNTPLKTRSQSAGATAAWRLPADLDPEWMALEVFTEESDADSDLDQDEVASAQYSTSSNARSGSLEPLGSALSKLNLRPTPLQSNGNPASQHTPDHSSSTPSARFPPIKTSLSLLEMLLKLTALQQFRQESHLAIEDELLNFFLEDSATAGAGHDKGHRQRVRHEATRRVGFDPYDESPVKRRGEMYIEHARGAASPRPRFDAQAFSNDSEYGYDDDEASRPHQSIEGRHSPYTSREPMVMSSPSPPGRPYQRTPSYSSPRAQTPVSAPPPPPPSSTFSPNTTTTSESHRNAVQAKYEHVAVGLSSSPSNNVNTPRATPPPAAMTPPSTHGRTRQAFLRAQSEPKVRSPLGREFVGPRSGFGGLGGKGLDEREEEGHEG